MAPTLIDGLSLSVGLARTVHFSHYFCIQSQIIPST